MAKLGHRLKQQQQDKANTATATHADAPATQPSPTDDDLAGVTLTIEDYVAVDFDSQAGAMLLMDWLYDPLASLVHDPARFVAQHQKERPDIPVLTEAEARKRAFTRHLNTLARSTT
jgi:hypothetical protein